MLTLAPNGPAVRKHLSRPSALLVLLALVGPACGATGTDTATPSTTTAAGAATGTITVSAAASLSAPFKAIGDDFRKANPGVTDVTLVFDSSSTLAAQIESGAPADVFAPADDANMAKLTGADLISGHPQQFARNTLTMVVKQGNPGGIRTLADLATAGTVSLCGANVPCGRYADQILTAAGVSFPAGTITRGQNARATLAAVSEGDADAGIVYVTDVTGDKVERVAIVDAQNAVASYPIAAVAASTNLATAQAFIAYVLSDPGQATLRSAGFLPPS